MTVRMIRDSDVIQIIELDDENIDRNGVGIDQDDAAENDLTENGEQNENLENEASDEMDLDDDEDPLTDLSNLRIVAHTKDIFSVDCLGGRYVATGGEDECAMLFDFHSGNEPVVQIKDHVDSVAFVRFNSSGTFLATGDMSGKIIITNVLKCTPFCEITDCNELEWMEWHTEADVLFAGAGDGMIWAFYVGQLGVSRIKAFIEGRGLRGCVGHMVRDGQKLIAGFPDGQVWIWSLLDERSQSIRTGVNCITIDAHRVLPLAAIGGQNGSFVIINTRKHKVLRLCSTLATFEEGVSEQEIKDSTANSIECLRFSDTDDTWLAVGSNNGSLLIYDTNKDSVRHICSHDGQTVVKCSWYTIDEVRGVLTASHDGKIRLWDARSGSKIYELCGGDAQIYDMCLSMPMNQIYTVSSGGILRMFDLPRIEF